MKKRQKTKAQKSLSISWLSTYVVCSKRIENVVRQTREQVYHKPSFYVVSLYNAWIGHYFAARSDKSSVKVEQNVDKEDDVNDAIIF